jgi:phage terminase large subunit-like protein
MSQALLDTPRVFAPLLKPSRYKVLAGGRGSGKSHFLAELVIERCLMRPGSRILCAREVQKSLRDSVKRLLEDKIASMGASDRFQVLNTEIKTPGGGAIVFQGLQDHTAESVKSLEGFSIAWVEEAQALSARSLELLRPTIRAPGSELWFSLNPRNAADPVYDLFFGLTPPPNAIIVRANYDQNPFFPPELEAERAYDERTKPERYGHVWLGHLEPVAIGAIWDRLMLHRNRRSELPPMARVLVAIDPAVSSEPGSDEHGIIVVGQGQDGRGYVLEDATLRGTPHQWADRALAMLDKWDADALVIERNQGGDMCRAVIQARRAHVRVIEVVATRGKHVRAEPIAALYSMDRVSHCGTFPRLEDQMCLMTAAGFEGEGSPDRVDALVWGFTELFPSMTRGPQRERPKAQSLGAGGWMG